MSNVGNYPGGFNPYNMSGANKGQMTNQIKVGFPPQSPSMGKNTTGSSGGSGPVRAFHK
jgi:hypothetical protein